MEVVHIKWLLSEMSIVCVRAGCEIQLVSYGSKHALQSLSNKQFVYTCITWKLQVMYGCSAYQITALLSETFLVCLELHERSNWKATSPNMHQSFSDKTFCVYTASPYIHHYLVHNCAWQQNSCTLDCILHSKRWLYMPTTYDFIRTKLASYTMRCSGFSINRAH